MNFNIYFIIFLIQSISLLTYGQQAPPSFWTSLVINTRFHKHWSVPTDIGYRTVGSDFIPYQNFIRSGIRYHITSKWSVTTGMSLFNTKINFEKNNLEYGHELRFAQEASFLSDRSLRWTLDHRLRLEQRNFSATSVRRSFNAWRFAYRPLLGYRINQTVNLNLGIENMETFKENSFNLDQLRYIAQVGIRIPFNFLLNLSYMYVHRPSYEQNVFNFVLVKNLNLHESPSKP